MKWWRERPELRHIVVVVLTSSDEERDHVHAYQAGARSYVVKPPDPEQLKMLLRSLRSYWSGFGGVDPILTAAA